MTTLGGAAYPVAVTNNDPTRPVLGGPAQPVYVINGVTTLLVPATFPIRIAGLTAWTDMPAALTEIYGSSGQRGKLDLTNASQARLIVRMGGTGGAASAQLRAQYSLDDSSYSYLDGGTGPACPINVTNTTVVSAWVNLVAAAKADVFLRCVGISGDGAIDPAIGNIMLQVR